jgi:hypothetical protein
MKANNHSYVTRKSAVRTIARLAAAAEATRTPPLSDTVAERPATTPAPDAGRGRDATRIPASHTAPTRNATTRTGR